MQSPEASGFARFGGFLLLVSLVLPYFALSFVGLGGFNFRLNTVDKGALVLVAAYGLLALAQVRFSTRETMAMIYLIVGVLFTGALIYKLWISPPGSAPIGDIPVSAGKITINGQDTDLGNVSTQDVLKTFGATLKPTYGAYVAMVGSAFFTVGAFIEWRKSGAQSAGAHGAQLQQQQQLAQPQVQPQQRPAAAPGYQQPAYSQQPSPAARPDPFAPPVAVAANPQAAVAQPVPSEAPQAIPQRPPGC